MVFWSFSAAAGEVGFFGGRGGGLEGEWEWVRGEWDGMRWDGVGWGGV